jgi:hypothetical protein
MFHQTREVSLIQYNDPEDRWRGIPGLPAHRENPLVLLHLPKTTPQKLGQHLKPNKPRRDKGC